MYTRATDPGPRYQWEPWDSKYPNGSVNCNPSSTAYIIDFYRDTTANINGLRHLVGVRDGDTVSTAQVETMLEHNGIPAHKAQLSISQLTSLVSTGRRPVLIGLWMVRVPAAMRGHPFLGMHGVVVMANQTRNGVPGKLVMDPNFNPWTGRDDPTHGERWYSDAVISWAMHNNMNAAQVSYGVVPDWPKAVSAPATNVFLGYQVVIEGAYSMNAYSVGAGCKLTPRLLHFSAASGAPVTRGTCGSLTFWRTAAGPLTGWAYVCNKTGYGWHIVRRYRRPDGSIFDVRIACTGS